MADEKLTELSPMDRAKRVAKDIYSRIPEAMEQYENPMASQSPISKSYSPEVTQFVEDLLPGSMAEAREFIKSPGLGTAAMAGLGLIGVPAKEIATGAKAVAKGVKAVVPKLKSLSKKDFPVDTVAYKNKMDVGPVRFDQWDGKGAVPDNVDAHHLGFVAWMTPNEFLRLNPSRGRTPGDEETVKYLQKYIEDGKPLSSPLLNVEEHPSGLRVWDHDGRHRMEALNNVYPDIAVPVSVFKKHAKRARLLPDSLADDLVDPDIEFNLIPDKRALSDKPLSPTAVWHKQGGKNPVLAHNPEDTSFTKPKLTAEELKMKQEEEEMLEIIRKKKIQEELERVAKKQQEEAERTRRIAERRAKMTPEEIEAEEKQTEDFIRRYFGYGDSE